MSMLEGIGKNNNINIDFGGLNLGLLTIVFITLKLTGFIDWTWFWILSPILIPLIFVLPILIIVFLIKVIF